MKSYIYIVIFLLFASSCKPGIPSDIIQPDEMALVLNDIHITDGLISTYQPDSAKILAAAFYNGIYKKYNIDSAKYYKSMDYYYKNPTVMDGIYKKVNAGLLKLKLGILKVDSLKNADLIKKADRKKAADSIRKIDSLTNLKLKRMADSVNSRNTVKGLDSIKKADAKRKKRINKKLKKAVVTKTKKAVKV
ncbi:DUF4296 domain-containing protein [Pedobacter sp. PWIIR3]